MKSTKTERYPLRLTGQDPLPPTQLLLRNINRIVGEQPFVVGVPRDERVVRAFEGRLGTLLTFDYGAFLLLESLLVGTRRSLRPLFGATYQPPVPRHDAAVVYLQKGTALNDYVLSMVCRAMTPGSAVYLVGENNAGIRSAAEMLEHRVGRIGFSDAARHCVLYEAHVTAEAIAAVDLSSWEREYTFEAASRVLSVVSLPGVFSHGRLDEGTEFLLRHFPGPLRGEVLDFGCGTGVIGAFVKSLNPECEITLVDTAAFALESTARTFVRNSLTAKAICPSDVFVGVDGRFDFIISNPPFHQGIGTNYDIVSSFIGACDNHLRPGGTLIVVANRFLPYEGLMAGSLDATKVVAEDKKYKVLSGRKRS